MIDRETLCSVVAMKTNPTLAALYSAILLAHFTATLRYLLQVVTNSVIPNISRKIRNMSSRQSTREMALEQTDGHLAAKIQMRERFVVQLAMKPPRSNNRQVEEVREEWEVPLFTSYSRTIRT